MKKMIALVLVLCFLLAGCGSATNKSETEVNPQEQVSVEQTPAVDAEQETEEESVPAESAEPAVTIYPLPDDTMENLTDAMVAISLAEGGAYLDDDGKLQMDVTIYSYYKYDMVDIAMMKEGDILLTCDGEVEVTSLERKDAETVSINGGVEEGGIDLVTNDGGFFYAVVLNDAICWYEVGEATIRVSVDFEYHDMSDLQKGDVVYYAGSFLNGEVTDYNFTPFNTTIRLEEGQIVEMIRVFVP